MSRLIILMATLMAGLYSGMVSAKPLKKICQEARVGSFQAAGIYSGINAPGTDYCLEGNEPFPSFGKGIDETIIRLGEIHRSIAKFMGMKIEELFVEPIHVAVMGGSKMATDSVFVRNVKVQEGKVDVVVISVDVYWTGGVNEAVYTHELGHLMARTLKNKNLPQSFYRLAQFQFAREMFPDLLAYKINKTLYSSDDRLPACFNQLRVFSPNYSYKSAPISFFQTSYSLRHTYECCKKTLAENPDHEYAKPFCQSAQKKGYYSAMNPLYSMPFTLDFYLPPMPKERPTLVNYDPHRIGLPVLSFLLNLDQELNGPSIIDLLMITLRELDKAHVNSRSCHFKQWPNQSEIPVPMTDIRQLFPTLRSLLTKQQQQTFDQLWERHGMNIIDDMIAIEDPDNLKIAGAEILWPIVREDRLANNITSFCRDKIEENEGNWYKEGESCYVVCQ
jgi:hypothetical protein